MKATLNTKSLAQGVNIVSRAVSGRSAWPILNNVLVHSEENQLRLTAFDLEFGIECVVPAEIHEEGALTVPAKLISEVLSTLADDNVSLSADAQNAVTVKAGKSDYTILGLPPEEFRVLPTLENPKTFTVPQRTLREAIRQTIICVSPDDSRAMLAGLLMEIKGDFVKLVATDGNRLAMREAFITDTDPFDDPVSVIIPRRTADEVGRLLEDTDDLVTVKVCENQVGFVVNGVTVVSRLIEGQFPNYERVIPKEHTTRLTLNTETFQGCVRRASIVARENANRVTLKTGDLMGVDTLTITAESGDVGKAHDEIEVTKEGEGLEMAFNAKYLVEFLSVVGSEGVILETQGYPNPAKFTAVGREDYLVVIMPMQLI